MDAILKFFLTIGPGTRLISPQIMQIFMLRNQNMDVTTKFGSPNRPPPHLEGNLVLHKAAKFGMSRSKQGFFVLLQTVLHQYETKRMYNKGGKPITTFEIHLEEVCGITECLVPNKQYKNCSFSLTLIHGMEYIFSAESREAMKLWVDGLRSAKEFWTTYHKREEAKQKNRKKHHDCRETDSTHKEEEMGVCLSGQLHQDRSELAQVDVTTWKGVTHRVVLPLTFEMGELLSALGSKMWKCASCPTCKLQQSSMEIWTVDESGTGKKLDLKDGMFDVSKLGRHCYVLVHNYKLLIIHFEDNSFQVFPCLVSLQAKEVPYLPIFADKLSSLGCSNFALYLVNEKGTSMPFHPEDEPLKHSLKGKLVLKNRALNNACPVSRTGSSIKRERLRKVEQNRKNQKALKIVEREKCRFPSNFPGRDSNNTAFSSPRNGVVSWPNLNGQTNNHNVIEASSCVELKDLSPALKDVSAPLQQNALENGKSAAEVIKTRISPSDAKGTTFGDRDLAGDELADCGAPENTRNEVTKREEALENESDKDEDKLQENGEIAASNYSGPASSFALSMTNELRNDESLKSSIISVNNRRQEGRRGTVSESTEDVTCINDNNCVDESGALDRKDGGSSSSSSLPLPQPPPLPLPPPSLSASSSPSSWLPPPPPSTARHNGMSVESSLKRTSDPSTSTEREDDIPKQGSCMKPESSVCKERALVDHHSCRYTVVGSPRVLDLVVRVCSSQKLNEEEVGDTNMFSRICLSGWHLNYKQGTWSVVERGNSLILDLSVAVECKLTETLRAFFYEEDKVWTVLEDQPSLGEDSVHSPLHPKSPVENYGFNAQEAPSRIEVASCEGNMDDVNVIQDSIQSPLASKQNESPSLNYALNAPKDRLENGNVCPKDKVENAVVFVGESSEGTIQRSTAATLENEMNSGNTSTEGSSRGKLNSAIRNIFIHLSKFGDPPENALKDSVYDGLIESICKPLCSALWDLLSVGLRKKMFFSNYTVWDVLYSFKDASEMLKRTVEWVNYKYNWLNEREKFQVFVCECLNIGEGTLHLWLQSLLREKQRLAKYYNQEGIVFQLSCEDLEGIVLDLSKISSLPFELHSDSWMKVRRCALSEPAFSFE